MKNMIKSILSKGVFALCILAFFACGSVFAEPAVKLGVIQQRYPWNGCIDVNVKVSGVTAAAGAKLSIWATVGVRKIEIYTEENVKNGEKPVTVNANLFEELKNKQLKDVKITARVSEG